MTQRTEHHYRNDFQQSYDGYDTQSKWIWGALAALAAIGFFIWLTMSSLQPSGSADRTSTGSVTPAPAIEEPAPVAPPVKPVQPQ